jgi:hypothetical protein
MAMVDRVAPEHYAAQINPGSPAGVTTSALSNGARASQLCACMTVTANAVRIYNAVLNAPMSKIRQKGKYSGE